MRSDDASSDSGCDSDDDVEPVHYSDRSKLEVPPEGDTFAWLAVRPYRAALKPWSFPSTGYTTSTYSPKSKRPVTLFSSHELVSAWMHERRSEVIEIFDQVPLLPTSEVRWLATRVGLRSYPKKGQFATTDLVLRVQRGASECWEAVDVKEEKQLRWPRVRLKLEVARLFWHRRRIAWRLDTDGTYSDIAIANARLLAPSRQRAEFMPLDPERGRAIVAAVDAAILGPPLMRLCDALASVDCSCEVPDGTAMSALRWSLAVGRFPVPCHCRISPTMLLEDLTGDAL